MEGGTTFHFVTDGIDAALERAREAAGDGDVSIAGGVSTLNAYLAAGLVDELRLHVVPFTVGEGLRVFDGVPHLTMVPVVEPYDAARHAPDLPAALTASMASVTSGVTSVGVGDTRPRVTPAGCRRLAQS